MEWILRTVTSALAFVAVSAQAQAVWFGPVSDQRTPQGFYVNQDYHELFESGAPWQAALSKMRVFEIDRRYIATQSEERLKPIIKFLRDRQIPLAVIFGFVEAKSCGQNVEGTAHRPDENLLVARRLKQLGGELAYAVVDEALYFGHFFKGKNACRYPIDELAAGFARQAQSVSSVFPDVEYVDTETSSEIDMVTFGQWLDALRREMGPRAPKSVGFDVQWYRPWQETVPPMIDELRRRGLTYGVIFKGTHLDKSDEQYIESAKQHIKEWQSTITVHPEWVLFQSWEPHPSKLLPESSPTNLPYLINWYCGQSTVPGGCR